MADRTSESVRRVVFMRALGRCEFGQCSKIAARYDDNGNIIGPGEFSHILPVGGHGPRAEFKSSFPTVDVDSPENVILLCREHHRAVDVEQLTQHPPALLFTMIARKFAHMSEALADLYVSNPYRFNYAEVAQDTRIGRIYDLMNEASISGPKKGKTLFARAAAVLRDIDKNPFIQISPELVELIGLEIAVKGMVSTYDFQTWTGTLARAEKSLRKLTDQKMVAGAILLLMVFVRDPYDIITAQERLRLIKALIDRVDPIISATDDKDFLSFLFGIKAALLRWRGRLQQSTEQQSTYGEALRCADRSVAAARSCSGLLQLALVKFAKSRSLPLAKLQEHNELLSETVAILDSSELDEFPAVIKYRPRFFRDIYEFEKGIDLFWRAVDLGYSPEMGREAFVIGECSVGPFTFGSKDTTHVTRAAEFLHEAIRDGYDHGRNFIAWIMCRTRLDPQWFQDHVLKKFQVDEKPANPITILRDDVNRYFGDDSFNHDVLFGVDEIEFWNMLGRLCRTALSDPDKALDYYDVAARYGGAGGNYTTRVGRLRALLQKRDLIGAKKLLVSVRSSTRAYQARILNHLESEFRTVEASLAGVQ